jgi:hypothetical protein
VTWFRIPRNREQDFDELAASITILGGGWTIIREPSTGDRLVNGGRHLAHHLEKLGLPEAENRMVRYVGWRVYEALLRGFDGVRWPAPTGLRGRREPDATFWLTVQERDQMKTTLGEALQHRFKFPAPASRSERQYSPRTLTRRTRGAGTGRCGHCRPRSRPSSSEKPWKSCSRPSGTPQGGVAESRA